MATAKVEEKRSDNPYKSDRDAFAIDLYEAGQFGGTYALLANSMLRDSKLIHPSLVYDLGCATGNSTIALAKRFPAAQIIGVDVNDHALRILRHKMGREKIDLQDYESKGVLSAEERKALEELWSKQVGSLDLAGRVRLIEQDVTSVNREDGKPADLVFASQLTHWIYNQGGEDKIRDMFKAAYSLLGQYREFMFSTFSQFCRPISDDSADRSIIRHPLHGIFVDQVMEMLSQKGHNPSIKSRSPAMDADKYANLLRETGFRNISARDIFVPYPLGLFTSVAYKNRPDQIGIFDGITIDPEEKKALLDEALNNALTKYSPSGADKRYEHSVNPSFYAVK